MQTIRETWMWDTDLPNARLPAPSGGLVCPAGGGVPAFWRRDRGSAVRQRSRAGGAARPGDPRGRVQARLQAFARHWRFRPSACAPYRARSKGKDERGVGYVKNNAIAGRDFGNWSGLEAHLDQWVRDIAD
jgi:hypothetical protein